MGQASYSPREQPRENYLAYVAELSGRSAAGDFAPLHGAANLVELVAVANLSVTGVSGWLLLHPGGRQAVMMTGRGQEPIDPLAASQISQIRFPEDSVLVTAEAPWAKALLGLLHYQFRVQDTVLLATIWMSGSLLAVTGVCGTGPSAEALTRGMVLGVRRLHEIDTLRRDVQGHRYLLARSGKTILLAMETGRIMAGTEGGLAIIRGLQPGGETGILPVRYRCAIQAAEKQVIEDDLRARISYPPLLPVCTTAEPLVAIRFSRSLREPAEGKFQTLSAAERRVYDRLMAGDRNKEIADRLGISRHTVRHHVSAVLSKTGYPDRVLLLAAGAKAQPPGIKEAAKPNNPQVPPLQALTPLPPAKRRIVGKRKVPEEA